MAGGAAGGLFTADTLRTIFVWQVAAQILGAAGAPYLEELTEQVNKRNPVFPLSPADLADMVVRGRIDQPAAEEEASRSGLNRDRFDRLVRNNGEPLGLAEALEAVRRGYIPVDGESGTPSLGEAVRTARYMNEWLPVIEKLRYSVPAAAEIIDGFVKAHLDEPTARAKFAEAGLDPDVDWQWMAHARGNPPSIDQVAALVHRGIVPQRGIGPDAVTFEQAVRESAYLDKWSDVLFEARTYIPPVRTIVALARAGAVTDAEAAKLFAENGVRPDDAAAYIREAHAVKTATDKQLAKGDVLTLYADQIIDAGQATALLKLLGYDDNDAGWLLAMTDFRADTAVLDSSISRIRSFYEARKIDRAHAGTALDTLGVSAGRRDRLLAAWDVARTSNVRLLTEAQVVDAWHASILDDATARSELEALGYTPFDAWVLLSVKNKGPLPDPPARTALSLGQVT